MHLMFQPACSHHVDDAPQPTQTHIAIFLPASNKDNEHHNEEPERVVLMEPTCPAEAVPSLKSSQTETRTCRFLPPPNKPTLTIVNSQVKSEELRIVVNTEDEWASDPSQSLFEASHSIIPTVCFCHPFRRPRTSFLKPKVW